MPKRKKELSGIELKIQEDQETAREKDSFLDAVAIIAGLPLAEHQKKMMAGILDLNRTTVKEIMTPRPEMACAEESSSLEQIKKLVQEKGHSRIPIYHQNIDSITGILHLRDLFVAEQSGQPVDLKKIARKPFFIPDGKKVDDLLTEMRKEKVQVALVVDEYGGIAGLVTMEDIIEEIIGDIEGEYVKEEPDIIRVDEHTLLVQGKVSLKEINQALGTKLPEEKFESVSGMVYDLVGGVPEQGKVVKHRNVRFAVEKVSGQRIRLVRVSRGK